MTEHNPTIRLYVATPLLTGALISLDEARAHYVRHVMRRGEGDKIAAFNAESGEWDATHRVLLYGDESGKGKPLPELLPELKDKKLAILIGPEGGFSADEHYILKSVEFARGFGMGSRILRADTAAVAALGYVQAATGDWNGTPHFKGNA
jgi:16S rRNA U1498 N3-methylase RsmE